jgi:hypothetical protein
MDTPEEMASFQFAHLLLPRLAFSDPAALPSADPDLFLQRVQALRYTSAA